VTVAEDDVAEAMVMLLERAKLVVEGAGAVGVAALLSGRLPHRPDGTTAVILSGGNVDAGLLADVARRHETQAGRRLVLLARLPAGCRDSRGPARSAHRSRGSSRRPRGATARPARTGTTESRRPPGDRRASRCR